MKYIYKLRVLLLTASSSSYEVDIEADGISIGNGNYEFYEYKDRALNRPIAYYPINNTIITEVLIKKTEDE